MTQERCDAHADGSADEPFAATRMAATRAPAPDAHAPEPLMRLSRGHAMPLPDDGAPVELWLASRRFVLGRDGAAATIADPRDRIVRLREGRNLVGRALFGEVVVDAAYADVSRSHLIVDVRDGRAEAITDVSSAGTFAPRALRARATRAAREPVNR